MFHELSRAVPRIVALIGFLAVGVGIAEAQPAQRGWVRCSEERSVCRVPFPTVVYYGAKGRFVQRHVNDGAIECSNRIFGDPLYGVHKACYYQAGPQRHVRPGPHVGPGYPAGPATSGSPMSGMPRLGTRCARLFREYMTSPGAKAFAASENGQQCGYAANRDRGNASSSAALGHCYGVRGVNCRVVHSSDR